LERTIGSERYRRFYLRDIEAIIIRRTPRRALFNIVWLFLALASAMPIIYDWQSAATLVTCGIVAGFWLILALANTLRGPTCDARIRTAVQIEPLPSLSRIAAVDKMLARVRPLIEQMQGAITPEMLLGADWSAAPSGMTSTASSAASHPAPGEAVPRGAHTALFSVLVISGVVSLAEGSTPSALSTGLDVLLSFVALIALFIALRRQSGSRLGRGVQRVTWAVVGLFIAGIAAGFVFGMIYAVRHPGMQPVDPLFFRTEPGFAQAQLIGGCAALVIGLAGLFLLFRPARSAPVAVVEEPVRIAVVEPPS
jgi:hypothetical protein